MTKGDRTGPMGTGAMSGRAAGFCAGFKMPGFAHPMNPGGAGMRAGRRHGGCGSLASGGRGWSFRPLATGRAGRMSFGSNRSAFQPVDPELEKELLRNRTQVLQSELDDVNRRLTEIESQEKMS